MKSSKRVKVTLSRRNKRKCIIFALLSPVVPILIFALLAGFAGVKHSLLDDLDGWIEDSLLSRRSQRGFRQDSPIAKAVNAVKEKLVLVRVDDETLKDDRFKQWPIPRTRYAELIAFLEKAGVKTIGIDVLFLERQDAYPDADKRLQQALRMSKNTIVADLVSQQGFVEPLPMLTAGWSQQERHERIGVTYEEGQGGRVVAVPLVVPYKGEEGDRYSFDAILAARALDVPLSGIEDHSADGGYIAIGQTRVPVIRGAMQINYFFKGESQQKEVKNDALENATSVALELNYIPMSALWDMTEDDRITFFKDKTVIVGVTAQAGFDVKMTPIGKMAGMEVHANALLTILSRQFLTVASLPRQVSVSLVLCLLVGLMVLTLDHFVAALIMIGLLGASITVPYVLINGWNYWFPPSLPALSIALAYTVITCYLVTVERRAKELMKSLFEKATPVRDKDVINFLLSGKRSADEFETRLEVRERTVLFSDIRDYTVMSESMEANEVMQTLNAYYSAMGRVINECGGKIWEYVGDAQMVLFGEPQEGSVASSVPVLEQFKNMRPADQAVHAAMRMAERLEELNHLAQITGQPLLDIGIGVNSGQVSMGTIVNKGKLSYAAIGDTTNVAARMQAMSKDLKCRILVSASTFDKLREVYPHEKVEHVKVKGKAEPMTLYRIFAGQQARERETATTT